ncbi:Protein of unknown function [Gryllus bimaculatus]|nr:Protein of unknown function [Gryllus bimaculatus]
MKYMYCVLCIFYNSTCNNDNNNNNNDNNNNDNNDENCDIRTIIIYYNTFSNDLCEYILIQKNILQFPLKFFLLLSAVLFFVFPLDFFVFLFYALVLLQSFDSIQFPFELLLSFNISLG